MGTVLKTGAAILLFKVFLELADKAGLFWYAAIGFGLLASGLYLSHIANHPPTDKGQNG
jgi:uncharacterized membrane protein YqhA